MSTRKDLLAAAADDRNVPPMTADDLDEWCAVIDALAQADQARGVIRNGVINAGQAAADVIKGRRGKS